MIVTLYLLSFFAQAITPEVIEHAQAGTAAMTQGKLSVAIEEFKKVIQLQPNAAPGYVNLGDAYFKDGSYELAIPELEHALKIEPTLLGAHQTLGVALLLRGNASAAIPHLEKTPDPRLLGLAYLESGRLADAIGAWQKTLSDHPDDPDALYYFSKATALASRQAYARLMTVDPGSARAHEATADRAIEAGRIPEALREYQQSIRLKPDAPGVHLAAGKALIAAANWTAAISEFQSESIVRPASAETFYYLGSAFLQQGGHAKEALDALNHSDQLQPNMPGTLLAVGKAAAQAGEGARAEEALKKVLETEKQGDLATEAHSVLADFYRKAGRTADADRETAELEKLKGPRKP